MAALFAVALFALAFAYSDVVIRVPMPALPTRMRRRRPPDLGAFVAEVSARLRSGAAEAAAWDRTAERHGLEPGNADGEPCALRQLAQRSPQAVRGARAAASLSKEIGAPLADILDHYGAILEQAQAAADAVRVALAGPRTSSRLLAALPLGGVAIGILMGANPLGAAFDGGLGTLAIAAGLILLIAGYTWSRSMIAAATQTGDVDEAIDAHLVAGALATGASIPRALAAVGRSGERPELVEAGELLTLGASWGEAWPNSEVISRALEPAWVDGANPLSLLDGAARTVLMRRDRIAKEAAARLSVRLVLPLGLCFLPAFILIGVVPLIIGNAVH